ncbi:amidase [Thelonectria olida]|uniref:amidase n=1 Tax=Thelonectria olida TaxID=1576542 RepID=A0A9P9AM49_9HYPO|nr:amidase [Thelonectria olida]
MPPITDSYKAIGIAKRLQRNSKIPQEWTVPPEKLQEQTGFLDLPVTCGVLTDDECDITSNYDATALLEKLKAGVWSCEQVTVAFCKRAAIAQQMVNCLTEIFFDDAINRARQLDIQRRSVADHKALPPLFGLPISLKDTFQVLGYDTSAGMTCYANEPAESHSGLAALLLDLGAVLYCKTNVPQSILTGDSDNHVFGRTLNPRNFAMTAGGSSGGEGALIALRGSLLGVGTDIAGSIRIPALCNGIYGMRPSVGIIPHDGVRDVAVPGMAGVRSTAGPLATTSRDLNLFLKSIMQADTWRYDSTIISLPWRQLDIEAKVRIGFVEDDGVFTPTPPVRRGLRKAIDLLQQSGRVEVIPMSLPNVRGHFGDLADYVMLPGSEHYYEQFGRTGEPVIPSLKANGLLSKTGTTLAGFFELNVRRAEAAKEYLSLFRDNNIHAIVMPPAPHTSVPLDTWTNATCTGLWNYLDYPATVLPVDEVLKSDHADDPKNAKYGPEDEKLYRLYTGPKDYEGLPVCIQVVGYRHADQALANTATILDSIVNGKGANKV